MTQWLAWLHSSHIHGWGTDLSGYVASGLVLLTFMMRSMRQLRCTAILSNLAFITYALLTDLRPILLLHSILLPVNIARLVQMQMPQGTLQKHISAAWKRSRRLRHSPRLAASPALRVNGSRQDRTATYEDFKIQPEMLQ